MATVFTYIILMTSSSSHVSPMVWGFLFLSIKNKILYEAWSTFVEVLTAIFMKFRYFAFLKTSIQRILVAYLQVMHVFLLNTQAFKLSFVAASGCATHCECSSPFTNWQVKPNIKKPDIFLSFLFYTKTAMDFFRRTTCTVVTDMLTTFTRFYKQGNHIFTQCTGNSDKQRTQWFLYSNNLNFKMCILHSFAPKKTNNHTIILTRVLRSV